MNTMKKFYKIVLLCSVVAIVAIIISTVIIKKPKEIITFLTAPHDHILLTKDGNSNLQVPLYSSEDTPYLQKDMITKCYIKNVQTNEQYDIVINDIIKQKDTVKFEEKNYYSYKCSFDLNFYSNVGEYIKEAILVFNYLNEEVIELRIGSISVNQDIYSTDFNVTNMKGIVNEYEGTKMLVGVCLNLSSLSNLKIKEIISLSSITKVDLKNITEVNINIESINKINDIIPNYQIITDNVGNKEIDLFENETKQLFIPLVYDKYQTVTSLGFKIVYEIDGKEKEGIIYPFVFFKTNNLEYINIERLDYETSRSLY